MESFLAIFLSQNKRKNIRVSLQLARADLIIHSQRGDWSLVFDPEKPTFSVSSEHKTTYKRPDSYSLPYFQPLVWKIRKIISQGLSTLTIWSCNVTTSTQEPPTCAWIRADIWRQDGAICSKNRKLSHIIGARGSQDLRSPSPIMAPDYT